MINNKKMMGLMIYLNILLLIFWKKKKVRMLLSRMAQIYADDWQSGAAIDEDLGNVPEAITGTTLNACY